jgi:hypothetical protein
LSRRSFSEGGLLGFAEQLIADGWIAASQLNKSFIFSISPGEVGLLSTAAAATRLWPSGAGLDIDAIKMLSYSRCRRSDKPWASCNRSQTLREDPPRPQIACCPQWPQHRSEIRHILEDAVSVNKQQGLVRS